MFTVCLCIVDEFNSDKALFYDDCVNKWFTTQCFTKQMQNFVTNRINFT